MHFIKYIFSLEIFFFDLEKKNGWQLHYPVKRMWTFKNLDVLSNIEKITWRIVLDFQECEGYVFLIFSSEYLVRRKLTEQQKVNKYTYDPPVSQKARKYL